MTFKELIGKKVLKLVSSRKRQNCYLQKSWFLNKHHRSDISLLCTKQNFTLMILIISSQLSGCGKKLVRSNWETALLWFSQFLDKAVCFVQGWLSKRKSKYLATTTPTTIFLQNKKVGFRRISKWPLARFLEKMLELFAYIQQNSF